MYRPWVILIFSGRKPRKNNLKHTAFVFTFFKAKFLMGAWENKCQISQDDILHMTFSEIVR